ncbi:asparagine--tRNA ligase [Desulfotalea psychrophila]|uniref:Asparagine--tRNA ligase n=1 Tax=Desulfotalea psychrophila (strain LSv54 / DSM 12343) TaxID=177439 RepID=SYN_DESPS|nr:asparagine--tRNA ligase [Desulfotalea psychrophila]Q6ANL4.1 RecName: Full=Asparagine--tRNA ligase; AltName: Full=Asparaginyl-tRNA synthetase; Short=AsnRS [Desulfotalea psychrophila LSv54]CAG36060.1 probable asparaginyl-tRNA synthetase [Desulfotalea psychrophila LSv54]
MRQRITELLVAKAEEQVVTVAGWIRTRRDTGDFSFLEVNDGSTLINMQVIADKSLGNYEEEVKKLSTGCSVMVEGVLKESPAKGQSVEVHASSVTVVGWADPETYPLQKKRHSLEFLREISHLRPRTNAISAVARVRSRLSYAVHNFFQEKGFTQVHTPIITTSDCEGAGEMFQVAATGKDGHFFGAPAGLTVSGQLQAEVYATALGDVYTFGPTFRAENSNTSRHLAEFWMIEPEMAFCDLQGDMEVAEEMLKYVLADVLEHCVTDMNLFDKFISKGIIERLQSVLAHDFARVTYTEAVDQLLASGQKFDFAVKWGIDLQSEHERYLTEQVYKRPLIVTDYPAAIKPFYMRMNEDGKTVAAMDILVPGIGELVGGSQREERYDLLAERMEAAGLDLEEYGWYLDLRKYGTVPHAGFGLGFERLVQFVTGMANIREVIPFPRTPGFAPC